MLHQSCQVRREAALTSEHVKIKLVIFVCYFQWCAIRVASWRNVVLNRVANIGIGEMKSESLLSMSQNRKPTA